MSQKTMCGIVFKCVIVWKPSSHIGLPIIRNQSKTTAIVQTFFFEILTTILDTKLKKFHDGFFWLGDARNIPKSFFIKNHC